MKGPNSAAGAARVVFCSHMQPLHAWGIWIGRGVRELKSLWMSNRNVEAERDYLCTFVCMHTHYNFMFQITVGCKFIVFLYQCILCGTCLFTVRKLSNFMLWKIITLQGLLQLANRSNRPKKKGIVKNSTFSFWLRISEILLLKWILKDPVTPASVMMCFCSGCQVEALWCEPHHELTGIFKLPLRVCFQSEWWRCLGWFYVHWIPSPVGCLARKCCCSPCSVILQSVPF